MDQLATLEERFRGRLPDLLGMVFTRAEKDIVEAELMVRREICTSGNDIIHGGAIMAFADTLGAVGTFMNISPDQRTATIESKTNFFAAGPIGEKVFGRTTPLHRGRQTQVWQTNITRADGRLVAQVTQTQMVMNPAP